MKLSRIAASAALLAVLAPLSAGAAVVAPAPSPGLAPTGASQDTKPTSYARIASAGAKVVNMQDAKGSVIHDASKGELVAVYRDTGRWLEVEVPGGFAVWVFGRYLSETAQADVYRVNGDGVNLRPSPSRGVSNFPLSQQLYTGDQVRVIERADPALPLRDDWVRIWSPPGVRGWLQKSSTQPLAAGEDGSALWEAALAALPAAPERAAKVKDKAAQTKPTTQPAEAAAPVKKDAAQEARDQAAFEAALATAGERMEAERAKTTPDWSAVRALYGAAERAATNGAELAQVRGGLNALNALEEASRLRSQLELERARREEAARLEQERVWAQARDKDPLGGVFLVRGTVERVVTGEGEDALKKYYLKFGTGVVSEIVCVSGRYDLDLFVGYQVGVRGTELRSADGGDLRHVEVTRLEVIARRP